MTIAGSCCCGGIRFELSEPPTRMGQCHCSRCRKLGASSFAFVRRDAFRWLAGEEMVAIYPASPRYRYDRSFCSRCGTALGEPLSPAERFPLNAELFDDDPDVRVSFHEFVAELPAWASICDDAPRFDRHPPAG